MGIPEGCRHLILAGKLSNFSFLTELLNIPTPFCWQSIHYSPKEFPRIFPGVGEKNGEMG